MGSNRRSVSVLALIGSLLLTGENTAQAAPNTFNTALPVAQGQYLWREQLVLRERSDDGPLDREVSVQALGSVLGYGVTSKFAVFGMVPYFFNKELDVTTPMGRVERDTAGFGDISLFGRYTLYKKDFTGSTFRVAPVFGLTAPTGDDNDSDRFGELPRPLQAGDGAWDVFGGAVVTYQTLQYQVDGQLLYRENGRHDGFARGDETRFDASLQYRIWPRSMKGVPGTPGFVYALLESNLIHRERDDVGSGTDANSGGTQWLLAPGLQYVSRGWIVEGTVQLPVAEDPRGDAIEDDYIVRVGFRRNF
ncbi:MAG: transporter [Marinobacter sp.]|uniref:transporter n=1 Tax=Marinobacter sp. TaxID=50741 RepID=UPI001B5229EC|nr:transporter [Marinobacter sp.]MBQ0746187.1 transporter [Marinobacter sp.]MBQ0815586.1 transporter [Marinobacter sp.]|tara:strand:- start:1145 stop:2062 length:918 start_codon:yes stop_codon:yes gene_type:complete